MNEDNEKLLTEVIEENLNTLLQDNLSEEERKAVVKETTELMDRSIQIRKIDSSEREAALQRDLDEVKYQANREIEQAKCEIEQAKFDATMQLEQEKIALMKKDQKINRILKIGEILIVPVALLGLEWGFRMKAAKTITQYEKDEIVTSTAGKGIIKSMFQPKNR